MDKVYIVMEEFKDDDGDDFTTSVVTCVFSSKEKAEKYIDSLSYKDNYYIMEKEVK